MLNSQPTIFDILRKHLSKDAMFFTHQGIDYQKNAFTLNVQQIQQSNTPITKGDIARLGLLPSGSKWRKGLGWYSVFGVPFKLSGKDWIAIGAEMIVKHMRGDTHPIFQAYIFENSPAQLNLLITGLKKIAHEIYPNSKSVDEIETGIVFSNIQTPQEYKVIEGHIIQSAINAYKRGEFLLFRTILLSEGQLKKIDYPTPTFWGNKSKYIMGTSAYFQSIFSWQTQVNMFNCKAYTLDSNGNKTWWFAWQYFSW